MKNVILDLQFAGFVLSGDFYTAAILANTIIKLVLKFENVSKNKTVINALKAEALLILVSIVRVGQSSLVEKKLMKIL